MEATNFASRRWEIAAMGGQFVAAVSRKKSREERGRRCAAVALFRVIAWIKASCFFFPSHSHISFLLNLFIGLKQRLENA
ncbi:unnamed protein product [Urochloa humidicola]